MISPFGRKNKSPDCKGVQSRDFSFLKGYLLSLSCLSSHLLMRWQTTPAATVARKVMMISIIFFQKHRTFLKVITMYE